MLWSPASIKSSIRGHEVTETSLWLQRLAPWTDSGHDSASQRLIGLRTCLIGLYYSAVLLGCLVTFEVEATGVFVMTSALRFNCLILTPSCSARWHLECLQCLLLTITILFCANQLAKSLFPASATVQDVCHSIKTLTIHIPTIPSRIKSYIFEKV